LIGKREERKRLWIESGLQVVDGVAVGVEEQDNSEK